MVSRQRTDVPDAAGDPIQSGHAPIMTTADMAMRMDPALRKDIDAIFIRTRMNLPMLLPGPGLN